MIVLIESTQQILLEFGLVDQTLSKRILGQNNLGFVVLACSDLVGNAHLQVLVHLSLVLKVSAIFARRFMFTVRHTCIRLLLQREIPFFCAKLLLPLALVLNTL